LIIYFRKGISKLFSEHELDEFSVKTKKNSIDWMIDSIDWSFDGQLIIFLI